MAEKFGGKFSPDGASGAPQAGRQTSRPRRSRAGARVNFLFIVPAILVFSAFSQEPVGMALDLTAFGVLMLAAWLTRDGLIAEDAYDARRVAKRPAIPRKIFGSALTGLGLAIAGYEPGGALINPAVFAVLGSVLHFFSFGADPLKDKGVEGVDSFQSDRVARAVDEAEKHLAAMHEALARSGLPALQRRMERFQETARDMFRVVEEDPRDLTGARRYLGVYLLGARDATTQFVDLWIRSENEEARQDYEALLDDLENSFAKRTSKMLSNDKSSLDVEIEVLRDRLAREGLRTE